MTTRIIAPPRHLANYIRFYWLLEFDGIAAHDSLFRVFARKYPRMVFQHCEGRSGIYHGDDYLPLTYLSGLNTLPYDCGIHPSISTIGVSFYPHAIRPIFGINVSGIVNELPDLSHFVKTSLTNQLLDARTVMQRTTILSAFFTNRLRNSTAPDKMYVQGWRMLLRETHEHQVRQLTRTFNLSERQLERRFKDHLGLTPKQYLKINRFEKALNLLQAGSCNNLFDIAYELGYADQSHFIREFKQFSGNTPKQYLNTDKIYDESSSFILKNSPVSGEKVLCRQSLYASR
ncbi:MAG: AraC family transcriptional regulator [Niastella sp.]|nr:AraC family transcriptional regulator [Niastella sp.]